ncbi:degenerin-like protein asic-1 [Amyelois transitella]|uniref:degenerin-like protein asic-1 n=1 Tax=Amyelois transitella TaxID=680683 RepID=UPI00067C154C|nr:degenerin-like protein asic-1 [Amyelois transitella]
MADVIVDKPKTDEDVLSTIKAKCESCIRGPNLMKTLIVAVCLGVVVQQITASIRKLTNKPITTYTHFDFNKTLLYPSVTFCKEPPYKYDKLEEYGLYAHPRYTSTWLAFNFSQTSLHQLWEDVTFNESDIFVQYGLEGRMENVAINSTLGFMHGRCYTLSPKVVSTRATRTSGYSITLKHSAQDVATSTSTYPPGYHVHVHYNREPFTEVDVYNGGHVDYFYVNTGDTIDVKLKVDQYVKIGKEDDPCTNSENYSANECTAQYVWDLVSSQAGCSGPWMKSNLPHCRNYSGMRSLISAYTSTYVNHNCSSCPRFCRSYLYNAFITDRQTFYSWDTAKRTWAISTGTNLQTNLYIYFNGMLVSVYEERYNYDWNLFLSDLGGSVGFLLGLSVISVMAMCGKIWSTVIRPTIKIPKTKEATIVINSRSAKHEEYMKNCREWNVKNNFY